MRVRVRVCVCARGRLEDIDDKTRVRVTTAQVVRGHVRGLMGAALVHTGLERFLEVVPLATRPSAGAGAGAGAGGSVGAGGGGRGAVGAGVGLAAALARVHLTPGVTDDRLWVLKVLR